MYENLPSLHQQITTSARETGTDIPHERIFNTSPIQITQPGYVYIYLSNESTSLVEVFFDDFKVTHTKSPVIQQDDYYPFGLTFNSYQRENGLANNFVKFQGQEHVDDLALNWDSFKWRNHQPDIGRFFNVDPIAEKYLYNSPYTFSENKLISFKELEGLEAVQSTCPECDQKKSENLAEGKKGADSNSKPNISLSNRFWEATSPEGKMTASVSATIDAGATDVIIIKGVAGESATFGVEVASGEIKIQEGEGVSTSTGGLLDGERKAKIAGAYSSRGGNIEGSVVINMDTGTVERSRTVSYIGLGTSKSTTLNPSTGESTEMTRVGLHLGAGGGKGVSATVNLFLGWENVKKEKK